MNSDNVVMGTCGADGLCSLCLGEDRTGSDGCGSYFRAATLIEPLARPIEAPGMSALTDEEFAVLNAEWERVDPDGVAALRRSAERVQDSTSTAPHQDGGPR